MTADAPFNIWIAEDPTQPGTAFSFHSDRDDSRLFVQKWREATWSQYNAPTRLIAREIGNEMLALWDRTKSKLCIIKEDACVCGEPILIEYGRFDLCRADGSALTLRTLGRTQPCFAATNAGAGWLIPAPLRLLRPILYPATYDLRKQHDKHRFGYSRPLRTCIGLTHHSRSRRG